MKRFTAFIISIFAGIQGYNQTNDSITLRITEFQWVALETEDSVYEFTHFLSRF